MHFGSVPFQLPESSHWRVDDPSRTYPSSQPNTTIDEYLVDLDLADPCLGTRGASQEMTSQVGIRPIQFPVSEHVMLGEPMSLKPWLQWKVTLSPYL